MKIWIYINMIIALVTFGSIFLTNLNRGRCAGISCTRADYYKSNENPPSEYFIKQYLIPHPCYDNLDKDIKEKYIMAVESAAFLAEAPNTALYLSLISSILLFISSIAYLNKIKITANKTDVSNPSSPDR